MLSPIIIIGIVRLSGSRGLTFGSSLVSVIIHSQASRGQDSELTVPEMAWTAGAVAKCCNECAFGTVKCVEMDVLMMMCAGPGLVFVVYPAAIARMPGSPVWAALFFVFLFTVGVDSQVRYSTTLPAYTDGPLLLAFAALAHSVIFVIISFYLPLYIVMLHWTSADGRHSKSLLLLLYSYI